MGLLSTGEPGQTYRTLSVAEIDSIVGRASTLAERLSGEVVPTGQDQVTSAKRLARWKRVSANDEDAAFRRVLGTCGVHGASESLLPMLGEVRRAAGTDLPRWAVLLQEIVPAISAAFLTAQDSRRKTGSRGDRTIPFAKLYAPIVTLARQKVEAMTPRGTAHMHERAWRGLESDLLSRLSAICSLALQPKFLAFRAVRRSGLVPVRLETKPPTPGGTEGRSLFQAFVNGQGSLGLRDFFLEYPVAARLAAQVTLFWMESAGEFLGRLEGDADELSARFLDRRPVGKIVRTRAGISDPHRGGRSVLTLNFESGLRLVYKPRPMQIDAAFSDLLESLNAHGIQPPLHPLSVLARESYGWETFVEYSPCRTRRAARHFYQRAGMLLYLIHALRGIDIHRENMIATAQGPVVVDLEALCHPTFPPGPIMLESRNGEKWGFASSVFSTGMLPLSARRNNVKESNHLSALGAPVHQRSKTPGVRWKKVNSDEMEAVMGLSRWACSTHRPRLHGKLLSVWNHSEDLVAGFRRIDGLLQSNETYAREWRERAVSMYAMKTRLIKIPTWIYIAMIRHSLKPQFLVSGVDRSIELQALPFTPGEEANHLAGNAALEVLDVPYFSKVPVKDSKERRDAANRKVDLTSQIAAIRASMSKVKLVVRPDEPTPRPSSS